MWQHGVLKKVLLNIVRRLIIKINNQQKIISFICNEMVISI